jgi:imidazolonepropionase-like amidohydrolase
MHFGHAWGRAPTLAWSADSSRFLLVDSESASEPHHADTTVLKSVNLEGRDERRLAHWSRAQRVSISPDGTRVGWVEDFRVYSATLPVRGGITLELGAETEPVPVTEHAETAGDWLAWTGDTLSHAHGPTIEWGEETLALSASLDRPVPLGSIAYTNVRVVTMGDQGVLENATVVVSGERIRSVGSQPPPPGARVIDATGKTLIPGLIDVHAHLHFGGDTQPQRSWKHEINLAYGVTSVHDPSAFNDTVFATAERIRAGLQLGPRVWSTGGVLYGAKGRYNSQIESLEDARFHVARQAELGAFSIKSYQQPSRRQRQWLIAAARDAGINVYPEGGGDLFHNMSMLVDGHTGIEHALPVAPLYADVRGLYAASGAGYTPTLLVAYGGLSGEHWFFQTEALLEDEKFLRFAPEEWVARNLRRRSVLVSDDDWFFREVAQAAAVLQDEGVPVLTGAHGQVQGVGVHWEMWALGGAMGPLNALRTATLDAAWYIGVEQDLGSIEVGKLADMVLIDGNPLEDLRLSVEIVEVMQGGTRFNAETLDEL